jgi:hypothetical protein
MWMNTTREAMGLHDGYGRRVKKLPARQQVHGGRMRREVVAGTARLGEDATELLCLTVDGKMSMFGPSTS